MARLPTPGQDSGQWGDILNDYLSQSHTPSGSLKDNSVGSAQLQDNSVTAATIADGTITSSQLTSAVQTSLSKADAALTQTAGDARYARIESSIGATYSVLPQPKLLTEQVSYRRAILY